MKAVPFSGRDVADDRIIGPLRGDGLARSDGDKEACLCTCCVQGGRNNAGGCPIFVVGCNVLDGSALQNYTPALTPLMVGERTSSHHFLTASRSRLWLSL